MDAKHYADQLAICAVTGDKRALVKVAAGFDLSQLGGQISSGLQNAWNTPALRNAMIGMGAGGLLGMLQPKRKFRNALQYGLLGGLGGLGYGAITGDLQKMFGANKDQAPAAPGAVGAPAAAGGGQKPTGASSSIPGLPNRPLTKEEQLAVDVQRPRYGAVSGAIGGGVAGGVGGNLGARYLERRLGGAVGTLADEAQGPLGEGLRRLRQYSPTGTSMGDLRSGTPGGVENARNFVLDAATDPSSSNRFLRAGINSADDAERAVNNAASLMQNERLPWNPLRSREVINDAVRVINADAPEANVTAAQLRRAMQSATPRMGWLRTMGTLGGTGVGAFLGGSAGANWDAVSRAQAAARLREAQLGVR